jgi:hypothetical protein
LTTRAFFSIVSRIRRSASSRIACFDIGLPRHERYGGGLITIRMRFVRQAREFA